MVAVTGAKGGTLARSDIAGIIGGELLARFRVIYDCPRARLHLEAGQNIGAPFEDDMSGIKWVASGSDRNHFRVATVVPDSPAARAGVAAGDVLIAVGGRTSGSFDREWLGQTLRSNGRRITLKFDRKGTRLPITIVLRRMV